MSLKNHLPYYAKIQVMILFGILNLGCQKNTTETSTEVEPANNAEEISKADAKKSVVLYSWAEYFSPSVIEEFEKTSGIEVDYQHYENNEEMFETLKSKSHLLDVVVMDDSSMERAIALRLLRRIDRESISNYKNIDPKYAPVADRRSTYAVPYMWGTTLLAYRSDKVDLSDEEKSWKLLQDPRFNGRISLLDERLECFGAALRILGSDPATNSGPEIEKASSLLVEISSKQEVRYGSDNDMKDHLRSGESWIAMMYSGDAALVAEEDESVGFFIPSEGATLFTDGFAIARDSSAVSEAHAFIDFMSDARIAGESSNHLWYATPNRAAGEEGFISEELATDLTIYPPASVLDKCDFAKEGEAARIRSMNAGWKLIKETANEGLVTQTQDVEE